MSQRIIFDDAINQIAAAERLSDAETSALRSELIRDALRHELSVWPLESRVKYDFNKVYSPTPSARFGSHDWCTVKTSAVEVYFNDLDNWLELNWSQLEFRFAKANPSSASDADITLDPTLATFDKRERRTVYQVARELALQIRPDDSPVLVDSMRTQTHRGIEGEIISAILDGSLKAYEGDLPHAMVRIKAPDEQLARMSVTLRLSRAILFLDEAISWLATTKYECCKLASDATPSESSESDAQASANESNQTSKELEPDEPWIVFCKSQIDDIFQSRIASGKACGVGYLAEELVGRCNRKKYITKRNKPVSKDNVLKRVLVGWTAPEIE